MSDIQAADRVSLDIDTISDQWKIMRIFYYLRLILALIIFSFFAFKINVYHHALIYYLNWDISTKISIGYLAFVITTLVAQSGKLNFEIQACMAVVVDILLLTVLMYFNELIALSLVVVVNSIIAGGALITRGKVSVFFAAVATVAIIFTFCLRLLYNYSSTDSLIFAALASCSYFFTALFLYNISRNMRLTQVLATQQAKDIQSLRNINSLVIQNMPVGIIVFDQELKMKMSNPAALKLLRLSNQKNAVQLENNFYQLLKTWQQNKQLMTMETEIDEKKLLLTFVNLPDDYSENFILFIEDAEFTEQRAQQLKLAALGKFTASIAHEIRNPLSSINQAAELLRQNNSQSNEDSKLLGLVLNNVKRIDNLVTNILQLAKRKQGKPERICLVKFIQEYIKEQQDKSGLITFSTNVAVAQIEFEPQQLRQVVTNLYENAKRYNDPTKPMMFKIIANETEIILELIDFGPGIKSEEIYAIFEPFYTTDSKGHGLGLYISKELCTAHHAELSAKNYPDAGACMQIKFRRIV